jgi:hypothetical protein
MYCGKINSLTAQGGPQTGDRVPRMSPHRRGPIEVQSAGGKTYEYVVVDDHTRAVYTRPLYLKSEAVDAFWVLKAVAECESGKKLREVMTDNAGELSKGEMRKMRNEEGYDLARRCSLHPMGLQSGRLGYSPLRREPCSVTRISRSPCGQRRSLQRHMFTTGHRRRHWMDVRRSRLFTA